MSAVSTSLERSQALKQIVFAFGTIVLKNVEATLVSVPVCAAADCAHAVSTNVVALDDDAGDGDGEGDADVAVLVYTATYALGFAAIDGLSVAGANVTVVPFVVAAPRSSHADPVQYARCTACAGALDNVKLPPSAVIVALATAVTVT
jgi:hypothetical protein